MSSRREKARYEKRWLSGVPSKEAQEASIVEKLRANFWGHKNAVPRCFTCRKGNASMPTGDDAPVGTESPEVLPCGCEYELAMLEMWLHVKGMWNTDVKMPKALGKHRPCMRAMFEIMFGNFTIEKMLNIGGARVDACAEEARRKAVRVVFSLLTPILTKHTLYMLDKFDIFPFLPFLFFTSIENLAGLLNF